ncbi:MAG: hypothetical protein EOP06_00355 [Proteobacteria bacterium]|nr:MAG: hypothetical protein EOP06_00355 [Pseudomonadota bacterium]
MNITGINWHSGGANGEYILEFPDGNSEEFAKDYATSELDAHFEDLEEVERGKVGNKTVIKYQPKRTNPPSIQRTSTQEEILDIPDDEVIQL